MGPVRGGVDSHESHTAPANVLWGVDNVPRPITNPDDVILLVALLEQDSTGAQSVRTTVELQMGILIALNLLILGNREEFVSRMLIGMQGAIKTAVKVGQPNPDDPIGPVKELRLSRLDVAQAFHSGSKSLMLPFKGDGANYQVFFKLKRA